MDRCNALYVGQTRRRISTRFKEHIAHFRRGEDGKSEIADHCLTELHCPDSSKLKLLRQINQPEKLNVLESIEIRKRRNESGLLNADGGPVNTILARLF